ncbi:hypothetical protein [Corynebacterium sp. TAE3-ERU16]|uniref:hypothetical protein n=1 Tax=Corynebacterium sp. TAE3-ERU16 TaxID=2849493 RepID=UPI001C44CFEE|nr:hypothetical protein [Corynebacterium sp. TAE3-ERU16]MBV7292984.1 hypothetical protein [Corynebacterium sp. TAE3-ERU16]
MAKSEDIVIELTGEGSDTWMQVSGPSPRARGYLPRARASEAHVRATGEPLRKR